MMLPTLLCCLLAPQEPAALSHGPLRGPNSATSLSLWARAALPGQYTLHLRALADGVESQWNAAASADHDSTLSFQATGLRPGAAYDWWITRGDQLVMAEGRAPLTTAMPDDASVATLAFGSCSSDKGFAEQPIWGQILARSPQALVLLGDTPYIDNGSIDVRRKRFREFFAFPPVRSVLSAIPTWTTWDDHDYAVNDTFGAIKAGETARQVFCEYHAHPHYGDGTNGIYTSFRRGPIEVFLLDTRSFADREVSTLAEGERSLLGSAQTTWLQAGLRASQATFKVLACGMIWNEGVRANKPDCWGNWLPERNGLLRWIGEQQIGGVVLVGGDVHRTRVILHPVRALAGYDVPELITSPLAQNVIAANKVDVPGLLFDAGESHSCMFLTATGHGQDAELVACFQNGEGREFYRRRFLARELATVPR
ncbi:MAG: alkaline phosphatase D family protein [Planctomycetes bacterium]|jgi:alkaline phosphatase D|nr:alkaline phosphatase D family protein [Planctomycetota bacterium]